MQIKPKNQPVDVQVRRAMKCEYYPVHVCVGMLFIVCVCEPLNH